MPDGTHLHNPSLQVDELARSYGLRRDYPRLPDQITVNFGRTAAVAAYILAADRAIREHGIRLSLSTDFDELAALNRANLADWYQLPTWYDPAYGSIPEGQGFWLRGIDRSGATVAAHAVRLYLCDRSTFKEEVESLRMIYSDVARRADTRTRAEVPAAIGQKITGRVTASGGLWIRSDFRGKGLAYLIPQLSRAISLTTWYPNYHTTLVEIPKAHKMPQVYGYRHSEPGMYLHHLPGHKPVLDFVICWATPDDMMAEIDEANAQRAQARSREVLAGAAE